MNLLNINLLSVCDMCIPQYIYYLMVIHYINCLGSAEKVCLHHIRSRKVKMYNNTSSRRNEVDDVLRASKQDF